MKKLLICFAAVAMTAIAANAQKIKFDVNSDSNVNTADVVAIYNYIITGDALEMEEQVFEVKGVTFTMMPVEGGTFMMGATGEQAGAEDDESPTHEVTLSNYYIGQTEVTQELWKAVTGSNWSKWQDAKLPVEQVSWNECQVFIRYLNELTGKNFRLPTEAEWEFAARGGNKRMNYLYSGSNTISDMAWYSRNSDRQTHVVASKQPNELGIYDMSGNVDEWCQDWYGDYSSEAQTNPTGPDSGTDRVYRGGCWDSGAAYCRTSNRSHHMPASTGTTLGLRLAL